MNLSNFSERLSELIFEVGKTADEVGKAIGCGNATISHYLTGRYLPTVEMTVKLADYFKCTTDFLLGVEESNTTAVFKQCPPFSEQLSALCKHFGISRYKLQKITGIAESSMRYWARGKTNPNIVNIAKIAEALETTIDFVLGRQI